MRVSDTHVCSRTRSPEVKVCAAWKAGAGRVQNQRTNIGFERRSLGDHPSGGQFDGIHAQCASERFEIVVGGNGLPVKPSPDLALRDRREEIDEVFNGNSPPPERVVEESRKQCVL